MKKAIAIALFVCLVILIGWEVFQRVSSSQEKGKGGTKAPAVAVEVAPVQTGIIRDVQTLTGTLMPKAYFVVAPKIAGRLKRLLHDIGDTVLPDELIAVLDDAEYVQQVEEARAALSVARATIEEENSALLNAQREYERANALREKRIASASELDAAQARLDSANAKQKVALAQVAQKEAALKAAEVRLSYTKVAASWENGNEPRVVGERFVDQGAMLMPNSPIVSVYDISTLKCVAYVIENDYPKIKLGQEAVITTDAYPGQRFSGRIVRMAPVLNEASRQARIELDIPNPDRLLRPGMFARIEIEISPSRRGSHGSGGIPCAQGGSPGGISG